MANINPELVPGADAVAETMAMLAEVITNAGKAILVPDPDHQSQGARQASLIIDGQAWALTASPMPSGDQIVLELTRLGPPGWDDTYSFQVLVDVCGGHCLELVDAADLVGARAMIPTAWDAAAIAERLEALMLAVTRLWADVESGCFPIPPGGAA